MSTKKTRTLSYKRRKEVSSVVIKSLIGLLFIFPVLIAVIFSFVPDEDLMGRLPSAEKYVKVVTSNNFEWILKYLPVAKYLRNSLMMCGIVIVGRTITGCLAAYAFAFLNFKGKRLFFQIMLFAMMVPGEVCTICNFITIRQMGLVSSMAGLTIIYLTSCHSVFMLRQSFLGLPKEMHEAAKMDGCGEMRYMVQFAIPLSLPTISSLAITSFIGTFNAYIWPLIVARDPDLYTVQIGMKNLLSSQEIPTYGRVMAGAVLCMVLPIVVFVFLQRYMVNGMTKGAVKG